jgi:hypothetical protein
VIPKLTKPWRYAAVVMAVLAFVLPAARLVTTQREWIPGCEWDMTYFPNPCMATVEYAPIPTLLVAALNAALWFGLVYLAFLVVYFIRRAIGRALKM